jgi:hypothetical protein
MSAMADEISSRALNRATLARQLLLERAPAGVAEVIAAVGPLQAQEPRPPFVALWSRIAGFERDALAAALAERRVVRAVWMRATLHLTTAADLLALRTAIQPALSAAAAGIAKQRDTTAAPADVAAEARRLLADGPLDRAELATGLAAAFPDGEERALSYIARMHLPLVAAPADDAWSFGRSSRFADAERWLGAPVAAEPATEILARRCLAAFGPASAADLKTFAGIGDARAVLEGMAGELVVLRSGRRTLYDLPDAPRPGEDAPAPPRLLAPFDSVLLAHQDRSRLVAAEHRPALISKNLRIPATFLVDGMVAGTWTLERGKVALTPFRRLAAADRRALEAEAAGLEAFVAGRTSTPAG